MGVFINSRSSAVRHAVFAEERTPPAVIQAVGTGVTGLVGQFPWGPDDSVIQPTDPADRGLILAPPGMSRIGSGWLADKVGGAMTLMIGSTLQAVALLFYLVADSVTSLYLASALFGLFQGGIVPSYAIIVREYFPAREAASRVGLTVSSTVLGMALGGWMGGVMFDLTGSYRAAFINGIGWNVLNAAIAWWLLSRQTRRPAAA